MSAWNRQLASGVGSEERENDSWDAVLADKFNVDDEVHTCAGDMKASERAEPEESTERDPMQTIHNARNGQGLHAEQSLIISDKVRVASSPPQAEGCTKVQSSVIAEEGHPKMSPDAMQQAIPSPQAAIAAATISDSAKTASTTVASDDHQPSDGGVKYDALISEPPPVTVLKEVEMSPNEGNDGNFDKGFSDVRVDANSDAKEGLQAAPPITPVVTQPAERKVQFTPTEEAIPGKAIAHVSFPPLKEVSAEAREEAAAKQPLNGSLPASVPSEKGIGTGTTEFKGATEQNVQSNRLAASNDSERALEHDVLAKTPAPNTAEMRPWEAKGMAFEDWLEEDKRRSQLSLEKTEDVEDEINEMILEADRIFDSLYKTKVRVSMFGTSVTRVTSQPRLRKDIQDAHDILLSINNYKYA